MGRKINEIDKKLQEFIEQQKIFFVGTAAADGRVNVSPKGMDSLRIVNSNRIIWLNVTGSGNETAAHLMEFNRITIMFCAFEGTPMILRLYGTGKVIHPRDPAWMEYINLFPNLPGARQLVDVNVELVQTSCGMAVPFMEYRAGRTALNDWATKKGESGIQQYWEEKNQTSLDGKPTGIF